MRYSEPIHIRVIRRWYKALIESIKVDDILPYLVSEEFVTPREMLQIKSKRDNYGRTDAAEHLVMNVLLRSPDPQCFDSLLHALRETTDEYLAKHLRNEYDTLAAERRRLQEENPLELGPETYRYASSSRQYGIRQSFDQYESSYLGEPIRMETGNSQGQSGQTTVQMPTNVHQAGGQSSAGVQISVQGGATPMDVQQTPAQAAATPTTIQTEYKGHQLEEYKPNPKETFVSCKNLADFNIDMQNRIGRGKFGIVFKGTMDGTKIAVKEVMLNIRRRRDKSVEELSRAQVDDREFQANVYIQHANVVSLLAYAIKEDSLYLAFEYIDGHNLENVIFDKDLHQQYNMSIQDKMFVIAEICKGVAYLHQFDPRVIHGDIKPANMIIAQNKTCAKLCDLGLCKLKSRNAMTTTMGHNACGTPFYMAPELLIDGQAATIRSDTWSLGASMYEILFEEEVWDVDPSSMAEIKKAIKTETPRRVKDPGVNPIIQDLARLISLCLTVDDKLRASSLVALKNLQHYEKHYNKVPKM